MRTRLAALVVLAALLAPAARADELDDEARALVDRWRDAQNRGDFAAYQALYAPRFTGVRRSGPREVRLDRAGWMKDRARMFGKPMKVEVESLLVFGTKREGELLFVQRFAQGNYRDAGRKSLVLVRSGAQLLIAREEMHDSTLADAGAPARSAAADLVGFVDAGAVVLDDPVEDGWIAPGKPRLQTHDDRYFAVRGVLASALPKATRDLLGETVDVIGEDGAVCSAKVKRFAVRRGVTPHFGTVQAWRAERTADGAIARDVEAQAGPTAALVGELEPACDRGLVARRPHSPAAIVAPTPLRQGAERARALAALRRQPEYATLQKEWSEVGKGRWDVDETSAVLAFDVTVGGKPERWLSAYLGRYGERCADWSGELWAVYRVDGERLVLMTKPGESALHPAFAVDLDGDGDPELVWSRGGNGDFGLQRGILFRERGLLQRRQELRTAYHDCPC